MFLIFDDLRMLRSQISFLFITPPVQSIGRESIDSFLGAIHPSHCSPSYPFEHPSYFDTDFSKMEEMSQDVGPREVLLLFIHLDVLFDQKEQKGVVEKNKFLQIFLGQKKLRYIVFKIFW